MKAFKIILILFAAAAAVCAQPCVDSAKSVSPELSKDVREVFEKNLERARIAATTGPNGGDADSIIWYGRRTAYLGDYKEAIAIFSGGAKRWPNDARFYRHRGHRLITLRCFDDAVRDLEKASKLIKGKKDEVEPDGLPNARNVPTSTLQSNIWYHLGLAYYLKGDLRRALGAYSECEKVSTNPDMLVATKHWQYMTLRRLGRTRDAAKAVAMVADGLDIIENDDYYQLIKLYQGKRSAVDLLRGIEDGADSLGSATLGYGIGNFFLYNGDPGKANDVFGRIVSGKQWASFGYIAAEAELNRR